MRRRYTATRDVLSAAVRLNLVGPLRAVALQAEVSAALPKLQQQGAAGAAPTAGGAGGGHASAAALTRAAGSAPLLEATHACHELLEMRLFQT